jgi:hypothetical protein
MTANEKYTVDISRAGDTAEETARNTFVAVWNIRRRENTFHSIFYPVTAGFREIVFENDAHFYEYVKSFWKIGRFPFIGCGRRVEFRRGRWCWKK